MPLAGILRSTFTRAVLVAYLARAAFGWLIVLPMLRVIGASGVARLAEGDAPLFQPGALFLAELVRRAGPTIQAALEASLLFGILALAVLAVPAAFLFASAERSRALAPPWPRALGIAPRFVLIGVLEVLAIALLLFLFTVAGSAVKAALEGGASSGRTQSLYLLAVLAPGLALLAFVRIAGDVLRTHSVRDGGRLLALLSATFEDLRRQPWRLFAAYTLASGSSLLVLALTSRAVELLHVERPGALPVLSATLTHQAALLVLTLIRAAWVWRLDELLPREN